MLEVLDAYIRVSQVAGREGESFISPALQLEQIERWLTLNGKRLGRVFEELDESGGRPDRPLLEEALARVEAGESGGIIVAKLDRFGRSVQHGLAAIARIEDAGGVFVSVQEGMDMSTPAGRLMIRLLFAFGEWELDHSRENWRMARVKAIQRGQFIAPCRPLGYRKGDDGRLRVDPIEAPIIAEVFRQRGRRISSSRVAAYLNASRLETHSGVPFERHAVFRITRNRVYLGQVQSNGVSNSSAHEPIVDLATWQSAQHSEPIWTRRGNTVFLLSGLIRCATCGYTMAGHRQRAQIYPTLTYRCHLNRSCPDRAAAKAEEFEPLVEQLISRAMPEDRRVTHWGELPIRRRREVVRSRLDCLYVEPGRHPIAERAWVVGDGSGKRKRGHCPPFSEVSETARRLEPLKRWPERELAASLEQFLADRDSWPGFEEFAEAGQAQLHAQAMIWGGIYHWAPRFEVEIPRGRARMNLSLLEGALAPFLEGRALWPSRREFDDAGLTKVRAAVQIHGGAAQWARQFGLPPLRENKRKWTMERIERELVAFTRGRTTFPTEGDFTRRGRRDLHSAMRVHGGYQWWAERLELRLTSGRKGRARRQGVTS